MQRICNLDNTTCVLLIEGDIRTAGQFTAYGSIGREDFTRQSHVVDDELSLLKFLGRAILSFGPLRFIQTKDELQSLRAVAGVAMALATSDKYQKQTNNKKSDEIEAHTNNPKELGLAARLVQGGILPKIAYCVEDRVHCSKHLSALYLRANNDEGLCRDLLTPVLEELCDNPRGWSAAVHSVFFSGLPDPSVGKQRFESVQSLVQPQAWPTLLRYLHSGMTAEAALDKSFEEDGGGDDSTQEGEPQSSHPRRVVHVQLPRSLAGLFPAPQGECFYKLEIDDRKSADDDSGLNLIKLQTSSGSHFSGTILVFLMEGQEFVRLVVDVMAAHDNKQKGSNQVSSSSYPAVSRSIATKVVRMCRSVMPVPRHDDDVRIFLLRGLNPALDAAAKQPGYCPSTRFVVDAVLATLMLTVGGSSGSHDDSSLVVLQAVRKTGGDCEKMLQQIALAAYQYQLLTHKK